MDTGRERDRFTNHTGYERASISLSSIVEPHTFRNGGIFLLNKLLERGKDTLLCLFGVGAHFRVLIFMCRISRGLLIAELLYSSLSLS